ncbi:MAG: tRNA pseudouridine(55) synthase TruB [Chloroflexi bacterium RBG_13_52_12]|nr:MAG: tRNA pseudouridine(55) synthase TruB [Chloroflexi bacterium RBG_13_52_12]
MDGILNIDKPAGKTSFGVVAMVKRLTGERHTGHAGTLDPDATGVLPICLGKGTRIIEFLMDTIKTYRAVIELGVSTDTYDASGKVTGRKDPSGIELSALEHALEFFRGVIRQTPPMYSALKHQGQPLYALARAGIAVERKPRTVTVYRLDLTAWQPPAVTLEIECSKGTYVRSLANDLGELLGCGASLKNLVRSRYGIFDIKDAISLSQLEEAARRGDWQQYLHPIDSVLRDLPSIVVDEAGEEAIRTGSPPAPDSSNPPDADSKYCRAYSGDGRFLGILRYDSASGAWHPKKVFI